jgi:hypothetical protein
VGRGGPGLDGGTGEDEEVIVALLMALAAFVYGFVMLH